MVWIVLVKNHQRSAAAGKVHTRSWGVVKDFIRSAYRVQRLNHFSCVCVYHHKLPWIDDVPAPEPASHEQAMVSRIQPGSVGLWSSCDGPLGNDGPFVGVNHLDYTLAIHDIAHAHVQPIRRTVEYDARRIVAVHLDAACEL